MKKICKQCKKEFSTTHSIAKYCSRQCLYDSRTKQKQTIICEVCGKKKKLDYRTELTKTIKFCSPECYHKARIKRVVKTCDYCGKEFYPSHDNKQIYCSRKCFFKGSASGKETLIERQLYEFLDKSGLEYIKQYYLEFTIPDAFIPSLNLCVYADGMYWHSYKINKGRDYRQNKKLSKLGYNFIRLKEQKDWSLNIEPLKQLLNTIK